MDPTETVTWLPNFLGRTAPAGILLMVVLYGGWLLARRYMEQMRELTLELLENDKGDEK